MEKIIQTTLINCKLEELFSFHLDSNNITKITPADIKVELLCDDSFTYEGKIVKLRTTKFFIPTYWEVKIEKIQTPNLLIDTAFKSPFKSWKHQHVFTQKGEQSELKDIIEYEPPFGVFGKILNRFIESDIQKMFLYRHEKTKELLETS